MSEMSINRVKRHINLSTNRSKTIMDIVPLGPVANLYSYIEERKDEPFRKFSIDMMLRMMSNFNNSGNTHFIYYQLSSFITEFYSGDVESAVLDISEYYQNSSKRHMTNTTCVHYMDIAIKHCLKFMRGDTDDRHDLIYLWCLLKMLWIISNDENLNDLAYNIRFKVHSNVVPERMLREQECQFIIDELAKMRKSRHPH